jgi:hypothetical protein
MDLEWAMKHTSLFAVAGWPEGLPRLQLQK